MNSFDESIKKVEEICNSVPSGEKILTKMEKTDGEYDNKHKKRNKRFKNWKHREFWRG